MNERQARRAASVCEAMAAAGWGLELSYARAYVYARLAALGAVDEAEALLPKIADPPVRAFAEGRVLGHRVARGPPAAVRAEFATSAEVAQYHTGLVEALDGADRPPPDALVRACVERARAQPAGDARVGALLPIADAWCGLLPAETWLEAVDGCAGSAAGVSMLFELAARRGGEPSAERLARVALERAAALPGVSPTRWFDELLGLRAALPRADALAFFVGAMARAAGAEHGWLLQDLHYAYEFEGLLRWLGGDGAAAAILLALDEVEALLA